MNHFLIGWVLYASMLHVQHLTPTGPYLRPVMGFKSLVDALLDLLNQSARQDDVESDSEEVDIAIDSGDEGDNTDETEDEQQMDDGEDQTDADADSDSENADSIESVKGIGETYAERLRDADVETVDELAEADVESLGDETDISEKRLERWIDRASDGSD